MDLINAIINKNDIIPLINEPDRDLNFVNINGHDALAFAVCHNTPVVKLLLEHGAKDTRKRFDKKGAVYYSIQYNRYKILKLLINYDNIVDYWIVLFFENSNKSRRKLRRYNSRSNIRKLYAIYFYKRRI